MTAPAAPEEAAPTGQDRFAAARGVADAVLFEGYVLYPYRASAAKNRLRWQFGVLVPPGWGAHRGEHCATRTECLAEPREGCRVEVELRFLHARSRRVERALPDGRFEPVDRLELPDRVLVPWDEGVEERVTAGADVADLLAGPLALPFDRPERREAEPVTDASGAVVGRLVRVREAVSGVLRLSASDLPGPFRVVRMTASVENAADWRGPDDDRAAALSRSLVGAHLMLGLTAGAFVSMTDPPEWARGAVAGCRNERAWPVLAGRDGGRDVVLSCPIILEDHPSIAPESPGALYDATEIDEILALRTAALTDEEKREARGTDDRAAAVVELADSLPAEVLERLHGAVRGLRAVTDPAPGGPDAGDLMAPGTPWWDPGADASVDPSRDRVPVGEATVGAGDRVVLRPGRRRTDAQDLFLHGRGALVEAVLHDVDGGVHLAVTVDGDPGADLRRVQGRFLYFQPDEVALPEGS